MSGSCITSDPGRITKGRPKTGISAAVAGATPPHNFVRSAASVGDFRGTLSALHGRPLVSGRLLVSHASDGEELRQERWPWRRSHECWPSSWLLGGSRRPQSCRRSKGGGSKGKGRRRCRVEAELGADGVHFLQAGEGAAQQGAARASCRCRSCLRHVHVIRSRWRGRQRRQRRRQWSCRGGGGAKDGGG